MYKIIFCIFAALLISACSVSNQEVEHEFNRFLGKSFKGLFVVSDSSYSFAVGDDLYTVGLEFSKSGYEELRSLLRDEKVTRFDGGFQFIKRIPCLNGYDFFLLTFLNDSENVKLQYGHE